MSLDPLHRLREAFEDAIAAELGDTYRNVDPAIHPATRPELGDFQCNAAMGLGKRAGRPPRELAEALVERVSANDLVASMDVAGPGFINIHIQSTAIAEALASIDDESLGVIPDPTPETVVIDMCGVNVAKQMHVGHLRSTIIGDAFARILTRLGHQVLRENHLGDWGLPIAMVLYVLRSRGVDLKNLTLEELDHAYRSAQSAAKVDNGGLKAAMSRSSGPHRIAELEEQNEGAVEMRRHAGDTLIRLQKGESEMQQDWRALIDVTLTSMKDSIDLLGVEMSEENNRGESFYRSMLPDIVEWFNEHNLCREDQGALVVDFEDRERPLLIRKSDGGYLYATTDLAAIRVRTQTTGATHCIYVVDARQRDHFRDVFDAVKLAGWGLTPDGESVRFSHTGFGSVLGTDRKPLKTRSGENVTLASLLNEAVDRGRDEVRSRAEDPSAPTHDLSPEKLDDIGQAVGIGAVKYADLSNDLVKDYVFDLDRMVAFEGDTGPYLQYAHARICSILRKADSRGEAARLLLDEPEERALALTLLRWNDVVHTTAESLEPHRIAAFLRELAEAFNTFYQSCPVMKAGSDDLRSSRLRLSDLTGRMLADGLDLLGIEAPNWM